ncbi:CdaR family protein [Winogradskyella sp. A3E31]|uniref:CdaR family protein n=1 Tax=Winogradskyella sp. A3E31 TaxID=3349637 RepID=UPI00398A8655
MKIPRRKYHFWKGKNIKGFGFFIIAAFVFLVLTKLSETYTQNIEIVVKVDGVEEEMKSVGDSTNKLSVLVKGRGFNFIPFMFNSPETVHLNFKKDLKKVNDAYRWDAFNNAFKLNESLGNSLEVLSMNPDTLYFRYDLLAYKYVPLKINKDLFFDSGFDLLQGLIVEVDSVKVVGLSEELKGIDFVETETITIHNISSDFEKTTDVIQPENSNIEMVPNKVSVKGEVAKFTEGEVKVPVILENVPSGVSVNFFPKEVDLLFYVSLEDYNDIESEDFKVICDYSSKSNNNQQFLIPKVVVKPEKVKRTRLRQSRIEFIILE